MAGSLRTRWIGVGVAVGALVPGAALGAGGVVAHDAGVRTTSVADGPGAASLLLTGVDCPAGLGPGRCVRLADARGPLAAGRGCAAQGDGTVICPRTITLRVALRDGDDRVALASPGLGYAGARVTGGPGDDVIAGGEGFDTIFGGPGDDRIAGAGAGDILRGGAGDDALAGGAGGDDLYGDSGADRLAGGGDLDFLRGGAGADVLQYGPRDVLSGGPGRDRT